MREGRLAIKKARLQSGFIAALWRIYSRLQRQKRSGRNEGRGRRGVEDGDVGMGSSGSEREKGCDGVHLSAASWVQMRVRIVFCGREREVANWASGLGLLGWVVSFIFFCIVSVFPFLLFCFGFVWSI